MAPEPGRSAGSWHKTSNDDRYLVSRLRSVSFLCRYRLSSRVSAQERPSIHSSISIHRVPKYPFLQAHLVRPSKWWAEIDNRIRLIFEYRIYSNIIFVFVFVFVVKFFFLNIRIRIRIFGHIFEYIRIYNRIQ